MISRITMNVIQHASTWSMHCQVLVNIVLIPGHFLGFVTATTSVTNIYRGGFKLIEDEC
jgi:hypothetical protein